MVKVRDWKKDGESVGVNLIRRDGDSLICEKDGFIFKVHRSNWPPINLSAAQCLTPTEYFKYQVRKLHGERYDLSPVVFTGVENNVTAICETHGNFSIPAKYFKSTRGCPACGYTSIGEKNRSNTFDFIKKATIIHESTYDYSLVDYKSASSNITVICKVHGKFQTLPHNHLMGKGCSKCGNTRSANAKRLTQDEVISRFLEKHGNVYDYSDVSYQGDAHGQLSIICKIHGKFNQSYANHNSGEGCPSCARENSTLLRSGFIETANRNKRAYIYLINCTSDSENFFKIGITTRDITRRFSGESSLPYKYELLHEHHSDGETVWNLETQLHRHYKSVKYVPLVKFGGMYECFSYIDLQDYKSVLFDKINSS